MDQENAEKVVGAYDHFVVVEVCLTDEHGIKMMDIVTKRVKDNRCNPREIEQLALFLNH